MNSSSKYGIKKIKRSAKWFVFGKALSAGAGVGYLLVLVRHLSVADFATYSVLQALVVLFTALTGFGLVHVTLRFIPELHVLNLNAAVRTFLSATLFLNTASLAILAVIAMSQTAGVAAMLGLQLDNHVLQLFICTVALRVTSLFLFQVLGAVLNQGAAQLAFAVMAVGRLSLILTSILVAPGHTGLQRVVEIELLCEVVGLLILSWAIIQLIRDSLLADEPMAGKGWVLRNRVRLSRFAFLSYVQSLVCLPYGSSTNRLVASHYLSAGSTAAFGIAQAFYEYVVRYMPANFFIEFVRPLLTARYVQSGRFEEMMKAVMVIFNTNCFLIGALVVAVAVSGSDAVRIVTNDKYGVELVGMIVAFMFVALLETGRQQLEMIVQIIEHNGLLIRANLMLTCSFLPGLLLVPIIGALALPVATALGLAAYITFILRGLTKRRFHYHLRGAIPAAILTCAGISAGLGLWMRDAGVAWPLALVTSLAVYIPFSGVGRYKEYKEAKYYFQQAREKSRGIVAR